MLRATMVKQVRAALEKDPRINLHRDPIAIDALNGDLVLTGAVGSIAVKKLALGTAAEIGGVRGIIDRLTVTPPEFMGDAEIRDHVCKLLIEEPAFEHCTIQVWVGSTAPPAERRPTGSAGIIVVAVHHGTVTLNGEVPSLTHKRLAGVLAWWVPGTRDVVNGLEEVPAEEDNDDELNDAVRIVLEKDPFVDAAGIRVSVRNWVVTLQGSVRSELMKQMAERDAWCVIGVKDVVNHIQPHS